MTDPSAAAESPAAQDPGADRFTAPRHKLPPGRERTDDATAALHRTHTEIFHLVRSLGRIVDELGADGPTAEDRNDLQRALYGLDAILRPHMAQEEELSASIDAESLVSAGSKAGLTGAYVLPAAMHTMATTASPMPTACVRVTRSCRMMAARMTVVTG